MPQVDSSSHARDLGYLDRFLAKLEAQALGMPAKKGQRLLQLLREEQSRWVEIKQLLGESPSEGLLAQHAESSVALDAPTPPRMRVSQGLTVGALIQS